MEMHHFSHDHPLMFTEEQKYDVDESVWRCDGCDLPISLGMPSYNCNHHGCQFKLHKACAEFPREIKHSLHLDHPLTLISKPSNESLYYFCDACSSWWKKFIYNCESCDFNLDPFCALPSIMGVHHFSHHRHPLMFTEEQKYDVNERVWCCDGCDLPISAGNPSYSCSRRGCEFKLHKVCAELPREIKEHPLHPNHTLILLPDFYFYGMSADSCNACKRSWEKFTYHCVSCLFDLDPFCALPSIMGQWLQFKHPSHDHSLTFLSIEALFLCNGCNTEHSKGRSYLCTICYKFWIHQDCALLPPTIKRPNLHEDHPLVLAFSIPDKYTTFSNDCYICYDFIPKDRWLYYCGGCQYFAHVNCAIGKTEPFMSILFPDWGQGSHYGRIEDIDESEPISLPVADESSWITNHFPKKMIIEGTKTTKHNDDKVINHFSHLDHPLILLNNLKKEESNSKLIHKMKDTAIASTSNSTNGGRKFCSGCLQTISKSTPYYACALCNYFLHQNCAFLPTKLLQHPFHPEHPLALLPRAPHFFGLFRCHCCKRFCNGFTYGCNTCEDYYLDLNCASLSTSITYEAHSPNHLHVLVLREGKDLGYYCLACYYKDDLQYMYQCKSCNFVIHSLCAQLPRTIGHHYDKHPFVLNYHPLKNHPEEYFCEICEEELNPQDWYYHCIKCDQSIHLFCYFDRLENLKYGGTINVNCHPHPLAFAKPEWDSECDSCGEAILSCRDDESIPIFEYGGIFECMRCVKYKMHWKCAKSCVLEN